MRTPGFGILALLLATPAYATASLSCSADDKSLRFSAEGIVSHGVGEAVAQFAGELEVRLKDAPPGLRKLPLALEHLNAALAARAGGQAQAVPRARGRGPGLRRTRRRDAAGG
jgi:hypothetical protein